MAGYVRMSRNYVNLGKLYSLQPWSMSPTVMSHNHVNLGNLYAWSPSRHPCGWAYFEDGSIYFTPRRGYLDHGKLEAEMRLLERFVRRPTPQLDHLRSKDSTLKRLIIIPLKMLDHEHRRSIYARNAADSERVVIETRPFQRVDIEVDPSDPSRQHATYYPQPLLLNSRFRTDLAIALDTFRGTLIGGVLQPNVRLGTGLKLSTSTDFDFPKFTSNFKILTQHGGKSSPMVLKLAQENKASEHKFSKQDQSKKESSDIRIREAELNRRERHLIRLQQELLNSMASSRSRGRNSPFEVPDSARYPRDRRARYSQSQLEADRKAAEIEAKERELHQREETLRWKHRSFVLEQKLAAMRGGFPHGRYQPVLHEVVPASSPPSESSSETPEDFLAAQTNAQPDSDYRGHLNPFDDPFDDGGPSLTRPRRSRIRLPRNQ